MADATSKRKIAVVAVHGVGDHEPFQSARAVGNLLANIKSGTDSPRYSPFHEIVLRLNVRRTVTTGRTDKIPQAKTWGPMDALAKELAPTPRALPDAGVRSLSHLFMDGQLAGAKDESADAPYTVLRLDGVREEDGIKQSVSVFDMHWADLSGVRTAFSRIFYELYQLLFHLTSVGSHNILAAIINISRSGKTPMAWAAFNWLYLRASQVLVWPIALLNLLMFALVLPVIGVSLLYTHATPKQAVAVVSVLGTAIAGIAAASLLMTRPKIPLRTLAGTFLALCVGASGVYYFSRAASIGSSGIALSAVLSLIAGGLVTSVVKAYAARRPGSGRAMLGCLAIWTLALVALTFTRRLTAPWNTEYPGIVACLYGFEILFMLASLAWVLFSILYTLTLASGFFAVRATPKEHRNRAMRTRWTAILTLTLPALTFLVITLAAWSGVLQLVVPILPGERRVSPSPAVVVRAAGCLVPLKSEPATIVLPDICYTSLITGETKTAYVWATDRMQESGVGYLPILFGAILAAMVMTAWIFGPIVWLEIKPPRASDRAKVSFKTLTSALGTWLSSGLQFLHWAGRILVGGMMLFLVVAGVILYSNSGSMRFSDQADRITAAMGVIVVGAGVGLIGFGGRLSKLALGFRPIVRVMLDVDDWLREHPRDSNPTARICARYTSLLRHIATHRDPVDQRPYDALVIVAHSQGTVITADLLRFLFAEARDAGNHREYDPELSRLFNGDLPIYFFTMGCPLNQLYALRFPYLYGWARTDVDQALPFQSPDILAASGGELPGPDPETLGVRRWINAYRSGDYVGRFLWRAQGCDYLWSPVERLGRGGWDPPAAVPDFISVDQERQRVEFCIGPGAHTHYWDSTAEPIAETLDRIITTA
jgi:hypothetical protein